MRGFEVVASAIAAFFVLGIGVGVLLVIVVPAFRRRRGARGIGGDGEYMEGGEWQEPPALDDDGDPPRWPGRRG